VLIDHQVGTITLTHSHDLNTMRDASLKLAKIARALNIPVVLTSSMEDQFRGLPWPEFEQILPEAFAARIKRPGIVNAMHHDGFNKAVKAMGRKKLIVAGVTTEICVTFPVLQMLDEGYDVQVAADASASMTKTGHDLVLRRMEQHGAAITTVYQIVSQLTLDWSTPKGRELAAVFGWARAPAQITLVSSGGPGRRLRWPLPHLIFMPGTAHPGIVFGRVADQLGAIRGCGVRQDWAGRCQGPRFGRPVHDGRGADDVPDGQRPRPV